MEKVAEGHIEVGFSFFFLGRRTRLLCFQNVRGVRRVSYGGFRLQFIAVTDKASGIIFWGFERYT